MCDEGVCNGQCWLNVGGNFKVWNIIKKHCTGSENEKNLIDEIFIGNKDKEDILKKINLSEEEKKIVLENRWD